MKNKRYSRSPRKIRLWYTLPPTILPKDGSTCDGVPHGDSSGSDFIDSRLEIELDRANGDFIIRGNTHFISQHREYPADRTSDRNLFDRLMVTLNWIIMDIAARRGIYEE
jgi:hypothetical protein